MNLAAAHASLARGTPPFHQVRGRCTEDSVPIVRLINYDRHTVDYSDQGMGGRRHGGRDCQRWWRHSLAAFDDWMSVSKMVAPLVILAMVPLLVTARKVGTLLMVEFLINFPGVNHTADHMLGVWSVKCARVLLCEEICQ